MGLFVKAWCWFVKGWYVKLWFAKGLFVKAWFVKGWNVRGWFIKDLFVKAWFVKAWFTKGLFVKASFVKCWFVKGWFVKAWFVNGWFVFDQLQCTGCSCSAVFGMLACQPDGHGSFPHQCGFEIFTQSHNSTQLKLGARKWPGKQSWCSG